MANVHTDLGGHPQEGARPDDVCEYAAVQDVGGCLCPAHEVGRVDRALMLIGYLPCCFYFFLSIIVYSMSVRYHARLKLMSVYAGFRSERLLGGH